MYQGIKAQLDKQLQNLKQLQSTLDLFGSLVKKGLRQSSDNKRGLSSNVSPISQPNFITFRRNLGFQFDSVDNNRKGPNEKQDSIKKEKEELALRSQRWHYNLEDNPECDINSKQGLPSQSPSKINSHAKSNQNQQRRPTSIQKKRKLQLQMDLLKRSMHLRKQIKRYGLKL